MRSARPLALFFWLLARPLFAEESPGTIALEPAEVFQGGTAQIRVAGRDVAAAKGLLGDREINFYPGSDGSLSALLGVDLEQRPGAIEIAVEGLSKGGERWVRKLTVNVKAKDFPRESLSVSPSFDRIDEAMRRRIDREQAELDRLWKLHSPERLWEGGFVAPVSGRASSPFGLRRVINGLARAPHTGVDLKATLGAEVVAANHGRVVLRDDFFFSGKSIVLDHGGGLYTMYFHLSDFRVEKNSQVRRGEVIGLAGMTGRVTGPHLHWGARLNGARVDPMELLQIEGERREAPPQ